MPTDREKIRTSALSAFADEYIALKQLSEELSAVQSVDGTYTDCIADRQVQAEHANWMRCTSELQRHVGAALTEAAVAYADTVLGVYE